MPDAERRLGKFGIVIGDDAIGRSRSTDMVEGPPVTASLP